MEKTSSKFTKMTAKEIHEINHFPRLTDIDFSNEWMSLACQKVWVKMKYGTLRGVIEKFDFQNDKITIKLEDGKEVYVYTYKKVKENWIKERS